MNASLRFGARNLKQVSSAQQRVKRRAARARAILSTAVLIGTSGLALAADRTWSGSGDTNNFGTPLNWLGGVAPVAGDTLFFDGFSRLTPNNNLAAGTSFAGINFNASAGSFTVGGNLITLNGGINSLTTLLTQNFNLGMALGATQNVSVVGNGSLNLGGVISGSGFGLTKIGAGTLLLGGANTFNGVISINAGVLSVGAANNLGAAPGAPTANSIIIDGAALRGTGNFAIAANRGIGLGSAVGAGSGTIDVAATQTVSYAGVIANRGADAGSLVKYSFGTLTLSGANTYTGATLVRNGTLALDFAGAGAPASNIVNSVSALTIGGATAGLGSQTFGRVVATGAAGATNSQTFASTHIDIGPNIINPVNGAGGTVNLNLGALTHSVGGIVNFNRATTFSGAINSTVTNTNGIIGGWATVGVGSVQQGIMMPTDFATVDGGGNIVAYTGYTDVVNGGVIASDPASNVRVTGATVSTTGLAAGGVTDVNTIMYNGVGTGAATTISIGAGNTLRLGKYGALFRSDTSSAGGNGGAPLDIGTTQNAGILTAGGADNQPGEIVLIQNASTQTGGAINIEAQITDNGTGTVTVVKASAGSSKLRGHNTYTGGTYLIQGRLQLAGSENGGTANPDGLGTGPLFVFPGSYFFPSGAGDFAVTSVAIPNAMFIGGNGTTAEPVGAIRIGNGVRIGGTVTLIGDSRIGGGNGGATGYSGQITGPFSLDLGAIQTINSNFSLYNPANDWTGTTTMLARNNVSANTIHNGASDVIPNGIGKGNVVLNAQTNGGSITWDMGGFNETINGLSHAGIATNTFIQVNSAGSLSVLTMGDYDATATYGGTIRDNVGTIAVVKVGGGLQVLNGTLTYTGGTTINGGTLSMTGTIGTGPVVVGAAGALAGASPNEVGAVTINNGRISPGATGSGSAGTLKTFDYTMNGGTLNIDVISSTPDLVDVNGVATFNLAAEAFPITVVAGGAPTAGNYTIFQASGGINYVGGTAGQIGFVNFPTVPNVRAASGAITAGALNISLAVTGGSKSLTWAGPTAAWDLITSFNWTDAGGLTDQFWNGDTANFIDAGSPKTIDVQGSVEPAQAIVNNSTGNDYTFTGAGAIAGTGSLTKSGTGRLFITNENTFTGGTTVNDGELHLGAGTTSGSLAGNINMNGGTVVINRSDNVTISNVVSGGGALRKPGTNDLTLTALSTFTGPTDIQGGTVFPTVGNGVDSSAFGGISGGQVTVANGAAIDLAQVTNANSIDFGQKQFLVVGAGPSGAGVIVNTGSLAQQNGFEQVRLAGDATFGGTARWDIRAGGNGGLDLQGNTLHKIGDMQFSVVGANIQSDGTIIVHVGTLAIETTSGMGGSGGIRYQANTTAQFFNNTAGQLTSRLYIDGTGVTMGNAGGTAAEIASPVTLGADLTITNLNTSVGSFTTTGVMSETGGARAITKTGNTLWATAAANTYTGGTTISAGTFQLGTGTSAGSVLGAIINNGNVHFNREDTATHANVISGTGDVRQIGIGTTVLTGANTYAGITAVNTGTLLVNGTHTGGAAYTVASGAALGGTGNISAQVNAASGSNIMPGASVGTLTTGALSLDTATLLIELQGSTADRLNTGALTLANVSNVVLNDLGGVQPGQYVILDYTGTPLVDLSNFNLTNTTVGALTASLVKNDGNTSVDLLLAGVGAGSSSWAVDNSGNWSAGGNWTNGVPNAVGIEAVLGSIITAPRNVTVDAPHTIGSLTFNNATSYTVDGASALTLDGTGSQAGISVQAGNHTISAPLNLADDTVINVAPVGSTLTVTGNVTATGRVLTKTGQGTAQLENVRSSSLQVNEGALRVSAKGTPNTAGGTSVVSSLSIAVGAQLDLTNNSAIVDYTGAVGSLVDDTRLHLQSGRLTTSSLVVGQRGLGYGDNAIAFLAKANFGGQPVDSSSLLIKYTYFGDLNLDGQVDITDLGRLATNWQTNGPWTSGDLDYNGFVDITDLGRLATNWQAGVGSPLGPSFNDALASVGLGGVSVPEPTTLGLLGVSLAGVLARRSRRN